MLFFSRNFMVQEKDTEVQSKNLPPFAILRSLPSGYFSGVLWSSHKTLYRYLTNTTKCSIISMKGGDDGDQSRKEDGKEKTGRQSQKENGEKVKPF
jgi:hypothetical protein